MFLLTYLGGFVAVDLHLCDFNCKDFFDGHIWPLKIERKESRKENKLQVSKLLAKWRSSLLLKLTLKIISSLTI